MVKVKKLLTCKRLRKEPQILQEIRIQTKRQKFSYKKIKKNYDKLDYSKNAFVYVNDYYVSADILYFMQRNLMIDIYLFSQVVGVCS